MIFHTTDWLIIAGFWLVLSLVAIYTRRYSRSVADFLVANRCADRYMLTMVSGINFLGAATIIAQFQVFYDAGFTAGWWNQITMPIALILTLSGWVFYRWRATRVLTQAQLFELRYSKSFRIFAGIFSFGTGVFGLGVMPPIAARFLMQFCHLPETFIFGGWDCSTYQVFMVLLILMTWFFTFMGGQISVMVTDFLQGMFCLLVFSLIFIFLMVKIKWPQMMEGLSAAPADASMIHPFHTSKIEMYNFWYFVWIAFGSIFLWPVHGMNQATTGSARTPHESHMATILGNLRFISIWTTLMLIPICAYVVMHHPEYRAIAEKVTGVLSAHSPQDQREIQVPLILSYLLPAGLLGGFAVVILAAFINTMDTYFLLFGGILIQDVILPFRKTPFTPRRHLQLLRAGIVGLGLISYVTGLVFDLRQDIQMFWALLITMQAGVVCVPMLLALYWRGGTTKGAWASAVAGAALATVGFYLFRHTDYPHCQAALKYLGCQIFHNAGNATASATQYSLLAITATFIVFIVVSRLDRWFGKVPAFNIDKMLHRGPYAVAEGPDVTHRRENWLCRVLQIDHEFTRSDRIIYFGIMIFTLVQVALFIGLTVAHLVWGIGDGGWALYWRIYLWVNLVLGCGVTVWLTAGGLRDMIAMFRRLKTAPRDIRDDGMVIHRQNADEVSVLENKQ